MTVAVEGVGDEVEWPEWDQSIEGPWGDAAHLVRVEGEGVKVDEAVEQLLVYVGDGVLREGSEKCRKIKFKTFFSWRLNYLWCSAAC